MRTRAALVGVGLVLAACSGGASSEEGETPDDPAEQDVTSATVCAKQTVATESGKSVIHCTETFAEAPYVHAPGVEKLPASTGAASFTGAVLAAATYGREMQVVAPSGARFVLVDAHGALLSFSDPGPLLKAIKFPSNLAMAKLYAFVGTVGAPIDSPWGKLKTLTLTSATPSVVIDSCALASVLEGTWEGTVSTRLAMPTTGHFPVIFDENVTAPIHVTLTSTASMSKLAEWAAGAKSDYDNFGLHGTIDNARADVHDGATTYKSLHTLGEAKEPFAGSTDGTIQLYRLGNMHGLPGDGHWVLDYPKGSKDMTINGMTTDGAGLFASGASWLIQKTPATDLAEITVRPHLPFNTSGHVVKIHPLKIGAKAGHCSG